MKKIWILIFCLFICLTKQIEQEVKENLKQEKTIIQSNHLKIKLLKEIEIQKNLANALKLINSKNEEKEKEGVRIFEELIKDHQDTTAMYQLGMYFRVRKKREKKFKFKFKNRIRNI